MALKWKLTTKEKAAFDYFRNYFNNLPHEQRNRLYIVEMARASEIYCMINEMKKDGISIKKLQSRLKTTIDLIMIGYQRIKEETNYGSKHEC